MIASLRGEVLTIGLDHAVIECGGIGYHFLAAPPTLATLRRGETAFVRTALAVKEDALTLYGFASDDERRMFGLLQTVSGLGPKLAIACLSVLGPAEISQAVADKDGKQLQTIPGVGKRMADRMVVELGGKIDGYLPATTGDEPAVQLTTSAEGVAEQVTEALVGLGFTDRVALPVVEGILANSQELDTAAVLRAALSELGRK